MALSSNLPSCLLICLAFCFPWAASASQQNNYTVSKYQRTPMPVASNANERNAVSSKSVTPEEAENWRRIMGLPLNSTSNSTKTCVVKPPVETIYGWARQSDNITESMPANSDGFPEATLLLTTSRYKESGSWRSLTTRTTITFPNQITQEAAGFSWYSLNGYTSSSGGYHFFPTASIVAQRPVVNDPVNHTKDILWTFSTSTSAIKSISYYQSLYPEDRRLHSCAPYVASTSHARPPIALNLGGLIRPMKSAGTESPAIVTTSPDVGLTNIRLTLLPKSSARATPGASPISNPNGPSTQEGESPTLISSTLPSGSRPNRPPARGPVNIPPIMTTHFSEETSSAGTSITSTKGALNHNLESQVLSSGPSVTVHSTTGSLASSDSALNVNGHTSNMLASLPGQVIGIDPAIITINHLTLRPQSASRYEVNGKTLLAGGPPITVSGSIVSLVSSASAVVVNGQTMSIPDATSEQKGPPSGIPSFYTTNGEVIMAGKILDMSSTITLGSGSVVTRIAMGTNSEGETVISADSITTTNVVPSINVPPGHLPTNSSTPFSTHAMESAPQRTSLSTSTAVKTGVSLSRWFQAIFAASTWFAAMR